MIHSRHAYSHHRNDRRWLHLCCLVFVFLHNVAFAQTATTTTLTTSQNAYVNGALIAAQSILSDVTATGTIALKDAGVTIATGTVTTFLAPVPSGSSMTSHAGYNFPNVSLSTGTHTLTAVYSGDGTFATSTSASYTVIVSAVATSPQPLSSMTLGLNGALNGFVPAPNDAYHQRIDGLPVDANSAAVITELSPHKNSFHFDLGYDGNTYYGIPYYVVDSSVTPGIPLALVATGEGPYVLDSDVFATWPGAQCGMWIEGTYATGGCTTPTPVTGDNHLITLDKATGVAYEGYRVRFRPDLGQITAVNTAAVDMTSTAVPQAWPFTTTRADAAGLSLFEGLLNYDEAVAGPQNHAIRMTTDQMRCDNYSFGDCQPVFRLPLTHQAQVSQHTTNDFGYGSRLRLKSSFNCAGQADAVTRNVCVGFQRYGVIVADAGSPLYLSGTPDARWQATHILDLQSVMSLSANWELVEQPTPYASNRYPTGTAAAITAFTASPVSILFGGCAALTSSTTNASYSILDAANAYLRGNSNTTTVCPRFTTTYTLYTKNANLNGSGAVNSQTVTIPVLGIPVFQGNTSMQNVRHN